MAASTTTTTTRDTFRAFIIATPLISGPRQFLLNNLIGKVRRSAQAGVLPHFYALSEFEQWLAREQFAPQVRSQAAALWSRYRAGYLGQRP